MGPPEKTPSPERSPGAAPHRRRPRYPGRFPRRFEQKYKEHDPGRYAGTLAKVLSSGKTPAGMHRPIMVKEVLLVLDPKPGECAVDCTLGYGGHAQAIIPRLQPGGKLLGLDVDPLELPKTERRLRDLGFGAEIVSVVRSNFAGLPQALARAGWAGADMILADLGVSSMQIDDPSRGFCTKFDGPLDMRMNPQRGEPASSLLRKSSPEALAELFANHSDEPQAGLLAQALAGREVATTAALAGAIRSTLSRSARDKQDQAVRRVFQALRIAVNDEFSALEQFLRQLPACLNPGGRIAILTFHSGEDRRVKKSFEAGARLGHYAAISDEVLRPTPEERHANPRSSSAKLRWARKSD